MANVATKNRKSAPAKTNKTGLQKRYRPVDFILCITVLLLLALGIVMVLSASSPAALAESGNSYTYVTKQAISAAIGLARNDYYI